MEKKERPAKPGKYTFVPIIPMFPEEVSAVRAKLSQMKAPIEVKRQELIENAAATEPNSLNAEKAMATALVQAIEIVRDYNPGRLHSVYVSNADYRAQMLVAARLLHPDNPCHDQTDIGKTYLVHVGRKNAQDPKLKKESTTRAIRPRLIKYLSEIERSVLETEALYRKSDAASEKAGIHDHLSLGERIKIVADELSGGSPEVLAAVQEMPPSLQPKARGI